MIYTKNFTVSVIGVDLTEQEISRILEEAGDVLDRYVADDGRVTFDTRAHIVTARKPSPMEASDA